MAGSEHRWHSTGQGYRSLAAPSINHQTTQIPLDLTEHFGNWRFGLGDTFNAMHLSVSWWLACSAGVFFGCANVFARESAMLKLPEERRKWGESKGAGRGRGERRENSPSPLSFFRPRTYRKGYYFYSPQSSTVIKSKMAATTILRTRTRFRPPKIRLHCRLHGDLYSDLWKIDLYLRPDSG